MGKMPPPSLPVVPYLGDSPASSEAGPNVVLSAVGPETAELRQGQSVVLESWWVSGQPLTGVPPFAVPAILNNVL